MAKKNAPGREAEGGSCLLAGDSEAHSTTALRAQFLTRCGLSSYRALIIAPLAFGEAHHG